MMKSILLGMVAVLVLVNCQERLWISQYSYSYKPVDNKWNAFIPVVYGGSGKYSFKYDELPVGWDTYDASWKKVDKNSLLIPKKVKDDRYQVLVEVYDLRDKEFIRKYLILDISDGHITLFVRDHKDKYFNFDKSYDYKEKDIIQFPSWKKVQKLIEDGDVKELKQIIVRVIKSDNDCDDKRAFLKGVLSRIDFFIYSEHQIVYGLKYEIKKLSEKIHDKKEWLKKLIKSKGYKGLSSLKAQLLDAEDDLEWYYQRAKYSKKDIKQYEQMVRDYSAKLKDLRKYEIPYLEREVKELEWKLKEKEEPYWWSKNDRWDWEVKALKEKLEKKKTMLQIAKLKEIEYEAKIEWFKKKIIALELSLKSDAPDIADLKEKIERLRIKIKGIESEDKEIEALKREIRGLEEKVEYLLHEVDEVHAAVNRLKSERKHFNKLVGKAKYDCEKVRMKREDYRNDEYYGSFDRKEYDLYMRQSFRDDHPPMPEGREVEVRSAQMYSDIWAKEYGPPKKYGEEEPFTCEYLQRSVSYLGIVIKIEGNSIWVEINYVEYELRFASCSTLEVMGGKLEKGRKMRFTGSKWNIGRGYNVRKAVCM